MIAIIITIMVLELKVPQGPTLSALAPLLPVLFCYVISFVYIGIYWTNHHHLFQATDSVNGSILWANLHLLFWLSLVPLATAWMGQNGFSGLPIALYGINLLMSGVAYSILVKTLMSHHGPKSKIAAAIGSDFKGNLSLLIYSVGIALAFFKSAFSIACYLLVAVIWLIPDKRIERVLGTYAKK